jgi:hypothetical protein
MLLQVSGDSGDAPEGYRLFPIFLTLTASVFATGLSPIAAASADAVGCLANRTMSRLVPIWIRLPSFAGDNRGA